MATAPTNVTVRQDISTYAYGLMQDLPAAMAVSPTWVSAMAVRRK
jgi:hypothetical protein